MRATTWFRVDRELGKSVEESGVFSPLILSFLFAFLIGTVIDFGFLVAIEAGQGAVILVFDWIVVLASALPGLLLGYFGARAGLERGVFGYWTCLLFGVAVVGGVSVLLTKSMFGYEDPRAWLVAGAHYGVLYGVLWGTLFWNCLLLRHPELRPRASQAALLLSTAIVLISPALFWFHLADRWLT